MNHSFLICLVSSQAHVWYLAILIQPANSHSISVVTGGGGWGVAQEGRDSS